MYHIRTTWYQLVYTWYEPAPKIRICRHLRTRATSPKKTFSPWTHTSDDSYIYQLSLVLATATVSQSARLIAGNDHQTLTVSVFHIFSYKYSGVVQGTVRKAITLHTCSQPSKVAGSRHGRELVSDFGHILPFFGFLRFSSSWYIWAIDVEAHARHCAYTWSYGKRNNNRIDFAL